MAHHVRFWLNIGNHTNGRVPPIQPSIIAVIIDISSVPKVMSLPYTFKKITHNIGKHSRDRNVIEREMVFVNFNIFFLCVFISVDAIDSTRFPEEYAFFGFLSFLLKNISVVAICAMWSRTEVAMLDITKPLENIIANPWQTNLLTKEPYHNV